MYNNKNNVNSNIFGDLFQLLQHETGRHGPYTYFVIT